MLELSTLSQRDQLIRLGQVADDLSLPFCQLEIQFILKSGSAPSVRQEHQKELATSLFESVIQAADDDYLVWLELISGLEPDMLVKVSFQYATNYTRNINLTQICRYAESKVLTAISDSVHMFQTQGRLPMAEHVQEDQKLLRRLMAIIDSTSTAISEDISDSCQAVSERLRAIAESLASLDASSSDAHEYISSLAETGMCHQ